MVCNFGTNALILLKYLKDLKTNKQMFYSFIISLSPFYYLHRNSPVKKIIQFLKAFLLFMFRIIYGALATEARPNNLYFLLLFEIKCKHLKFVMY